MVIYKEEMVEVSWYLQARMWVDLRKKLKPGTRKQAQEPRKHILFWHLTDASLSLQNDFLGFSVYTMTD